MDAKRGEGKASRKAAQAMRRAAGPDAMLDMVVKAHDHREARNGFTEAMEIINISLPKAFAKTDGPTFDEVHKRIIDEIYGPMLSDTDFTEPAFEKLKQEIFEQGRCIDLIQEVVAYCVFAVRAFFSGRETLAWTYACDARYWAGVVMMVAKRKGLPDTAATAKMLATMRSTQAREAAAAMLARSPIQAAKTEAFKLWQERYAGQHPRLRTNEQFATECMRRWPVLTSSKVITGWCTQWNKQSRC